MAQILGIKNPNALKVPDVWTLFKEMFDASGPNRLMAGGADAVALDIASDILSDETGIFIAYEDGTPVGMSYINTHTNPWHPHPEWLGWYNKGSKQTARELADAGVAFIRQSGYTTFRAFNGSGRPDSVWARSFRRVTKSSQRLGAVMEFEVKDA